MTRASDDDGVNLRMGCEAESTSKSCKAVRGWRMLRPESPVAGFRAAEDPELRS